MYIGSNPEEPVDKIEPPVASPPVTFRVKSMEFGSMQSVKNMKMELELAMPGPVRRVRRPLMEMNQPCV